MDPTTSRSDGNSPERPVDRLLAHYAQSHRHPINERIHMAAIPAIMLSIIGLLYALHPWIAYLFVAASVVYYLRLHTPLPIAALTLGWTLVAFWLIFAMEDRVAPICAVIFVVGWIFQFIGHRIEGRKPSFFEDIQYLWIGPLFVAERLLSHLGVRH